MTDYVVGQTSNGLLVIQLATDQPMLIVDRRTAQRLIAAHERRLLEGWWTFEPLHWRTR
jgi:hypothetical protein